jgi:hypothetical protein
VSAENRHACNNTANRQVAIEAAAQVESAREARKVLVMAGRLGSTPKQERKCDASLQQVKAEKLFNPCRSTYGAFPPVFTEVPRAALPCL